MIGPLPSASLIICSRSRPQLLRETVESVLAGDEVPAELVIVDQSQEPNPYLAALGSPRGCRVRYCPSGSTGLCRARNEGIAAASHDLLAFIDDDMRVESNWYGLFLRALVESGPKVVVTGRVLPAVDRPDGFVPAVVTGTEARLYTGRIGIDVLAAGHMAMFRSAYLAVGPFDERLGAGSRFPASDDNDYGFRLLESGYAVRYVPEAVIYHKAWRGKAGYRAMRWSYGRGKGGFYAKYLRRKDPYLLTRMMKDVGLRLVRFPWRLLHRPDLAVGDLYYAAGVLSGWLDWLASEQKNARPDLYPPSFRPAEAASRQAPND